MIYELIMILLVLILFYNTFSYMLQNLKEIILIKRRKYYNWLK